MARMILKGIFPALTTPFGPDGDLYLEGLRQNIARYNKTAVAGYVVNGSTGESVLLRWDEVERAWEAAREAATPGKLLIAGGTSRYEVLKSKVTRAAGVMTIRNEEPRGNPIHLPSGSEFLSPTGIAFRSIEAVTIPPATCQRTARVR